MIKKLLVSPFGWLIGILLSLGICIGALFLGSLDAHSLLNSEIGHNILWNIRLPRVLLAFVIGASLSLAGVMIQSNVRNPLADPGLIGVSAGAALGAALVIVASDFIDMQVHYYIPVAAFIGGILATIAVLKLGRNDMPGGMALLILAGIAINVVAASLIGLLTYLATDSALRHITFWSLGSLASANYFWVILCSLALLSVCIWLPRQHRKLDAILLGQAEANTMGVDVKRLQIQSIVFVALLAALAVSACGIIGFIGLVTPHIGRMLIGASHRYLLPLSFFLGGSLLVIADGVARTIIAPAELPIGIVTALLGAPVFIWLLIREGRRLQW
ncbi:MAG: iron complex transport system permease protein [Oleispira sp.]|jgi:iron complex transport system permease protein